MLLSKLLKEASKNIPRPFGIFLSGGLDSGILAALLKPDVAITCNFQGEFYDELEYAYAITQHLDIKHYVIQPDKDDFKPLLKKALTILGKSVNSVSIFPWYYSMQCARDLGMKTMVGGEGADEVFGGYSRYLILKGINNLYEMESLKGYYPMLEKTIGSISTIHSKMTGVSYETLEKRYEQKQGFLNQIGWAEYKESLPSVIDMQMRFAKHFSIEHYLPFMLKRIADYGFSLKDNEKINGEERKLKVLEIAKELLPEKVWKRKDKKGFVCPVNEWCGSKSKYDKEKYLKLQNEIINNKK